MSSVSRWAYTNTATVWRRIETDSWAGGAAWGEPFQIACTWTAGSKVVVDNGGKEFVSTCEYFHEDKRVDHGDRIVRGVSTEAVPTDVEGTEVIKSHTDWDMSFFGRKDREFPDFRSVT